VWQKISFISDGSTENSYANLQQNISYKKPKKKIKRIKRLKEIRLLERIIYL